ncbi:hypothetical protein QWY85_04895 [Neolewinella lacunae]|uniref:DUF3244 domain-containing protein n=1 Tax=Neolewinella lacunae TaxID=1517758 RepID=A0A923TAG1_9BACT|nr:hypothetical protein [Neolewinella lacunae]MBC6996133.1 hypothetical protein [Neolewinella lacunae]MDN3633986.1 hypothetical protein [Neolewinella lacunae]
MNKIVSVFAVAAFLATSPLRAQIVTDENFLQSVSPLVQTDPETAVSVDEGYEGPFITTTLEVLVQTISAYPPGVYLIQIFHSSGKMTYEVEVED